VQDLQLTIVNDSDQGLPAGATSVSYLSAITYGSGNLYVFGTMESRPRLAKILMRRGCST